MPQCLIEIGRQANRFDDLASVGVGGVSFRSQAARRDQAASDLKRPLPCLIAYRTRGIVVLSTAVTSVVATVGISIMAVPDCVSRCGTRRGLNHGHVARGVSGGKPTLRYRRNRAASLSVA